MQKYTEQELIAQIEKSIAQVKQDPLNAFNVNNEHLGYIVNALSKSSDAKDNKFASIVEFRRKCGEAKVTMRAEDSSTKRKIRLELVNELYRIQNSGISKEVNEKYNEAMQALQLDPLESVLKVQNKMQALYGQYPSLGKDKSFEDVLTNFSDITRNNLQNPYTNQSEEEEKKEEEEEDRAKDRKNLLNDAMSIREEILQLRDRTDGVQRRSLNSLNVENDTLNVITRLDRINILKKTGKWGKAKLYAISIQESFEELRALYANNIDASKAIEKSKEDADTFIGQITNFSNCDDRMMEVLHKASKYLEELVEKAKTIIEYTNVEYTNDHRKIDPTNLSEIQSFLKEGSGLFRTGSSEMFLARPENKLITFLEKQCKSLENSLTKPMLNPYEYMNQSSYQSSGYQNSNINTHTQSRQAPRSTVLQNAGQSIFGRERQPQDKSGRW